MIKPLIIDVSPQERHQLKQIVRYHPLPYMRERAAAILKVADGAFASYVAKYGLLQVRHPDTVCTWVRRFQQSGIGGLKIKPGRGRKPAFSPSLRRARTG
jgi:transposase